MSQTSEIRAHLETGAAITPIEALAQFNCFRLGARIYDLRCAGLPIESETVEHNDKRFARYRLATKSGATA